MKRLFSIPFPICLFCFFFFIYVTGAAQQADKARHLEVAGILKKEYNAKNYKVVYGMLDKEFRKQISEKELADFFKFNISDYYGEILDMKFDSYREPYYIFATGFQKGRLDLVLNCDAGGKISGMQWLPHKETEPVPKINTGYQSDNSKKTAWDLKVDSIVASFMLNADNCGLSIAVLNNNAVSYYNYGMTKRGNSQLPSKSTIYEIGSVSKTFTGILLAKAVVDKKVNLTDDIRNYLPGEFNNLRYKDSYIQLQHLANHTSRIPRVPLDIEQQPNYDPANPYKNYNKDMVFAYLKRVAIDTIPGTKNEYSNLGMALLGIILEKVYNKSYEELVKEFIARPLGMEHTGIKLGDEELKLFATGYDSNGNEATHWDLGDLAAAGGIRSTTEDMMKYIVANIEEKDPAIRLSHSATYNDTRNYTALAWQLLITKKANMLIWHNGGTYGFTSFCGFISSKGIGVVILNNSGNSVDYIALGILKLLQ